MAWLLEGDHQRCERHDTSFTKLECCPACETDPGPPPAEQVEHEDADPDAAADEQWCRDQRDMLIAVAKDAAGQQGHATDEPTEPGADGEERSGWFFWRGKWRPVDPPKAADVGLSTVAKLADTALKFHRAAVEERRRRGERDHDRWLVRQARQLKSIGVIN